VVSNTGSETWISEGSTRGVWDMSGGSANLAVLDVGHNGGGNATLTVSGAANLSATNIRVGPFDSVNGTVNLNGGTINANQVSGGGGGSKIFNFNGGTLKARVDNATFMQGLSSANVQNGGAIIDSNGFSVTAAQALVAGGTGGLTKNGTGTLTVNGANTYTGPTTVNAGTLNIGQSSRTSSALVVANGDCGTGNPADERREDPPGRDAEPQCQRHAGPVGQRPGRG
jgi:autotransporter-associated beta strand protein